jgi:DNA anti-recombination protein RmuC
MAEQVPTRHIIFEDVVEDSDDTSFSEKLQSMANEAGERYSDMTKAVSEALLGPTSTQTVHVTKLAAEKYSSALSAASVALYGTEKGTGESVSSVVASRYSDAVAA